MRRNMATAMLAVSLAAAAAEGAAEAPEGAQVAAADKRTSAAITKWRAQAAMGDAEAEYSLGQAYRRGDGVPLDTAQALSWYLKAAGRGHALAQAQLGLMLFTSARRPESFPWLEKAAAQGEPRAQYVLGTALFNGDGVAKDWPRAYAMMSRAAAGGLDPATRSLAQMETYLPAADKQMGVSLARAMAARETVPAALRQPPAGKGQAAPAKPAPPAPAPARTARNQPSAAAGGWRVQLGAFGQESAARAYWTTIATMPALSGLSASYTPAGSATRLRAGPFASKADADKACAAISAAGKACFPVAP